MVSIANGQRTITIPSVTTKTRRTPIIYDRYLLVVIGLAVLVSIVGFLYFFNQGATLLYPDAQARLLITRRVVDSPTAGFAQLGGVWPPLTHIIALPFIANDFLYHTGIALSIQSMIAYVLVAVYLYKALVFLTDEPAAGLLAALIFVSNPNIIYMQSTAMTELPMYAALMASVYYLLRMGREPERPAWLIANGIANLLGCLIRYEVWIVVLMQMAIVFYIYWRHRFSLRKVEAHFIYWAYWALLGIAIWVVWNALIFGDPLAFQRGEYAKPSLWVTNNDPVVGHLDIAFLTYWFSTLAVSGVLFYVGIFGAVYYTFRQRLRADSVAVYAVVGLFPAFVAMLYGAQRPMQITEVTGGMYNIRFSLVLLLPLAIFIAYMAQRSWLKKALIVVILMASNLLILRDQGIITLREPIVSLQSGFNRDVSRTATWLQAHYDGDTMLLEGPGNELLQFTAQLPLKNLIYEGSYKLWELALSDPAHYAEWIFMRSRSDTSEQGDKVWQRWNNDPYLHQHYTLVYEGDYQQIYRRRTAPQSNLLNRFVN